VAKQLNRSSRVAALEVMASLAHNPQRSTNCRAGWAFKSAIRDANDLASIVRHYRRNDVSFEDLVVQEYVRSKDPEEIHPHR
jgi:hypothetical protein